MIVFTLSMKCNTPPFEDNESQEVARILRATADRIDGHPHFSPGHSQPLLDADNREVGRFDVWKGEDSHEEHIATLG